VEEQFYILWPLVVAGVALVWAWRVRAPGSAATTTLDAEARPPVASRVAAPTPRPPARWAYAAPMGALCLASFSTAMYYAHVNPAPGYFMTHVRLYELGLGGLLGVWASRFEPADVVTVDAAGLAWPPPSSPHAYRARTLGAVVGVAGIAASGFLYTPRLPFPGVVALVPVLATALAIVCGEKGACKGADEAPHALAPLLAHPWLQYIGDISYSLYLAHWPIVVIYPFATGKELGSSLSMAPLSCAYLWRWRTLAK